MSTIMINIDDKVNNITAPAVLGGDALDLVHTVMHQYRSEQYQVLRGGECDVTHMESKVLTYFGRHSGATQCELSGHNGRDKAQLARLIKGLRERNFLAAKPNPKDKRSTCIFLTESGSTILEILKAQAEQLNAKAVAGLSINEQQQLILLLERIKKNLSE
jgi:DNA-binding MarR family transcriptional regulator